jgi:hypothetical protein
MKKKQYVLRNGLVVIPFGDPDSGNVRVVSVPEKLREDWIEGDELTLKINFPELERVLAWTGGIFGRAYDVVRELEGG